MSAVVSSSKLFVRVQESVQIRQIVTTPPVVCTLVVSQRHTTLFFTLYQYIREPTDITVTLCYSYNCA